MAMAGAAEPPATESTRVPQSAAARIAACLGLDSPFPAVYKAVLSAVASVVIAEGGCPDESVEIAAPWGEVNPRRALVLRSLREHQAFCAHSAKRGGVGGKPAECFTCAAAIGILSS